MKYKKFNFLLYILITIILIDVCSTSSDHNFSPFSISYRIINKENIKQNKLQNIESQLIDVFKILNELFYTNLPQKKIELNSNVLKQFNITLKRNFDTEYFESHLLLLILFKRFSNKQIGTIKLYKQKQKDSAIKTSKKICNLALLTINSYLEFKDLKFDTEFKLTIINRIFKVLGFRSQFLKKRNIRNNFNEIPFYLIEDMSSFRSYQKYLRLKNKEYKEINYKYNGKFYISSWPNEYGIHDIMSNKIYADTSITEITTNLFNDLKIYSINKCDLIKYKAGFGKTFSCHRVDMKCIDEEKLNNDYFLEYAIFDSHIICYLNDKNNILNNQCGNFQGNLRNSEDLLNFCPLYYTKKQDQISNIIPIPEINNYENLKLKLIKKPKNCLPIFPRTIFFTVPYKEIFDEYKKIINISTINNDLEEINKNTKYEEIILTEKKFYPTYQAPEENYERECVLQVLNNSGVIRSYSNLNSHNILFQHPGKSNFEKMHTLPFFQKLFSYVNFGLMSNKDLTLQKYNKMKNKFPNDYNYLSESFLYPEDKKLLKEKFKDYKIEENNLWLIKPKSGSLGKGISIFFNFETSPDDFLLTKYISHPHLINNKKYDFRCYILITGIAPLKIYLYKEGLVRFASEEYSLDLKNLKNNYKHLTNLSLNKKNTKYFKKAKNVDTEEGNKWSFKAYENYCKKNNINYENIKNQIKDIIIKEILSSHKELYEGVKNINKIKTRNFFHLYGFDFLPDENLKIFFLEGNDRPSLMINDINDKKLKPQLVADILNIVGIVPYSHDYKDDFIDFDNYKKNKFPYYKNEDERVEFEVEDSLCEFGRPRGRFELIFPLKENIKEYKKYFEVDLKENELLWEYILGEK